MSASLVEHAISCALNFYWGKVDASGLPSILHPLRVMARMDTEEERVVAVLHDLPEDSENPDIALAQLALKFPVNAVGAIADLTRDLNLTYREYIVQKVLPNKLARRVKRADLLDNLARGGAPASLIDRYTWALRALREDG